MIKNVRLIFILLLATSIFSVSFIGIDSHVEGLSVGDKAPYFTLHEDNGHDMNLKMLQGNLVLVSFWASYDASSRIQNATLSHVIGKAANRIKMVSVSFDDYESIFKEAIKQDNISSENCYLVRIDRSSELYKTYKIRKGFRNYLLNERGEIVAKDITPSQLKAYFN
ncbi:MAG: TlpA family protein disulfide reductase [Phocaeicola sp.]|uniref:TlpA family protein disulfide reductase n=1 Tax=Phocaeicola TaxID=909656 RepID=UPI00234ED48E|nr:thioredoxin-like domain-containing protein [Phocaeicola oris]MCE2615465.1 redoxin domain-containing protein [Phocaeicola oris]